MPYASTAHRGSSRRSRPPSTALAGRTLHTRALPSGEAEIDAATGTLTGAIGAGSRVGLSTGTANDSQLIFDAGTEIAIQKLRLFISDKRSTAVRFGGGSTLKVNVRGGRLGMGDQGFVALASGRLEGNLSGDWDSADRPDATLQLKYVEVGLAGGELDLNAATHLRLTGGTLKSQNLQFRGLVFSGITGEISDLALGIDEDSRFGSPDGFRIVTAKGGHLELADPTRPMKLAVGAPFPSASIQVVLPFKKLLNASAESFALTNGEATQSAALQSDGAVKGTGQVHGDLLFTSALGALAAKLDLYGVQFEKTTQAQARLIAKVKAQVLPGLQLAVRTPFHKGYVFEVSASDRHRLGEGWLRPRHPRHHRRRARRWDLCRRPGCGRRRDRRAHRWRWLRGPGPRSHRRRYR